MRRYIAPGLQLLAWGVLLYTPLLLVLSSGHSVAYAANPVTYIVQHNPELSQLRAISSWWSGLSVKLKTNAKYGYSTYIGAEEIETSSQARGTYDLRITAEIPLVSPKEAAEARLQYYRQARQIRYEAAKAIAQYRALQRKLEAIRNRARDEYEVLKWLEQRVAAGVELQEKVIEQKLKLKATLAEAEQIEPELDAALEYVLSFVDEASRPKLREMLERAD